VVNRGYPGKTRKGFGQVNRHEVVHPKISPECGGQEFADVPVSVGYREITELVEPAIKVTVYEQQCYACVGPRSMVGFG
jgi:transposase